MIVVTESNTSQSFDFIPRYGTPVTCELTDENTNVPVIVSGTFTSGDYVHSFSAVLPTLENHLYWVELKDVSNNVLLKERMFCTNQPIDTFSVNNGGYVSNQTTNDFIMYE
jgi:hypothetical protein